MTTKSSLATSTPRTVHAPLTDGLPVHLRCVSNAQKPPHSLKPHSLYQSHGGASPAPPPPLKPSTRRSIVGGRRRSTPTSCTTSTSSSSLELGASPSFSLHLLPLPQASSKENKFEFRHALYPIFKLVSVFHSSPVSSFPPRSIPIALGLKAMKPS